jgi:hypothetical protein
MNGGYVLPESERVVVRATSLLSLFLSFCTLIYIIYSTFRSSNRLMKGGFKFWWIHIWFPARSFQGSIARLRLRSYLLIYFSLCIFVESLNACHHVFQASFPFVRMFPSYYLVRAITHLHLAPLSQMILALRLETIITQSHKVRLWLWHGSLGLFVVITPFTAYLTYRNAVESNQSGWQNFTGSYLATGLNVVFPLVGAVTTIQSLRIAFQQPPISLSLIGSKSNINPMSPTRRTGLEALRRAEHLTDSNLPVEEMPKDIPLAPIESHSPFSKTASTHVSYSTIRLASSSRATAMASSVSSAIRHTPSVAPTTSPAKKRKFSVSAIQFSLGFTFKLLTTCYLLSWLGFLSIQTFSAYLFTPMLRFRIISLAIIPGVLVEGLFRDIVKQQEARRRRSSAAPSFNSRRSSALATSTDQSTISSASAFPNP